MKRIKQNFLVSISIFSLIILNLAGCQLVSKGNTLSVDLPSFSSRAVYAKSEISSYALTLSSSSVTYSIKSEAGKSATFSDIKIGSYVLTVDAYAAGEIRVATGSANVEVSSGENTASVALSWLDEFLNFGITMQPEKQTVCMPSGSSRQVRIACQAKWDGEVKYKWQAFSEKTNEWNDEGLNAGANLKSEVEDGVSFCTMTISASDNPLICRCIATCTDSATGEVMTDTSTEVTVQGIAATLSSVVATYIAPECGYELLHEIQDGISLGRFSVSETWEYVESESSDGTGTAEGNTSSGTSQTKKIVENRILDDEVDADRYIAMLSIDDSQNAVGEVPILLSCEWGIDSTSSTVPVELSPSFATVKYSLASVYGKIYENVKTYRINDESNALSRDDISVAKGSSTGFCLSIDGNSKAEFESRSYTVYNNGVATDTVVNDSAIWYFCNGQNTTSLTSSILSGMKNENKYSTEFNEIGTYLVFGTMHIASSVPQYCAEGSSGAYYPDIANVFAIGQSCLSVSVTE